MISNIRAFLRVYKIARVAIRWRLDEITPAAVLFSPLSWLRTPAGMAAGMSRGMRLRKALEELGPLFVKFGQILSTRRDLMPADIADELALLQDRVAPFPNSEARAAIEKALGDTLENLYGSFEEAPLASASIAQVHAATLKDGRQVVVKVLRPGIAERIRDDISVLKMVAAVAEKRLAAGERIRPRAIVAEIERSLTDELDLLREGANGSVLKRNFAGSSELYVPEMIWALSKERALTMERVYGIPLNDLPALRAAGVDFAKLAERCVRLFYTQVFRDNFFHADLHPGNLLISLEHPEDPQVIAMDFGIMGQLAQNDQFYLAENFTAMFNQDYRRVAELHIDAGWMPAHIRVDELEGAVRTICEPYFTRPLSEVSLGEVLMKLFALAQRYELTLQPQLILLQKTLLNVEGIARMLWPKLDIWSVAKPVLAQIMAERYGWNSAIATVRSRLPGWIHNTPEIPQLAYEYLKQAHSGRARLQMSSDDLKRLADVSHAAHRHMVLAILGMTLLIVSTLLYALGEQPGTLVFGMPAAPLIAAIGAAWAFVASWPTRP